MGYPDYPNNRLIVNGVDLTTEFGIILGDGYVLEPPSPKTYTVDIPSGNGKLDLTESLFGDTVYENRKQEFTFYAIYTTNFEQLKTKVSNFLHGKSFYYRITMDPEYTYHGRFTVSSYTHTAYSSGILGTIKITIDADPYKYKETKIYSLNAIGGNIFAFESGRKRIIPIFETDGFLKVIYNGKKIILQKGTWTINDLQFTNGINTIYLNSYEIRNCIWGDLKTNSTTWGQFKKKRLFEWYKSNGLETIVSKNWMDISNLSWSSLADSTWASQTYKYEETGDIKNIYMKYEWGDL